MIQRVLFVYLDQESSSYSGLRGKPNRSIRRRPQLGFQYLSSVLESAGVDTVILDQTITPFTVRDLAEKVKDVSCDIVGFYTATALKDKVRSFISGLKEATGIPIIAGGPGSVNGGEYLEAGCDIVCNGEGEKTILDIIDHYNGKRELATIRGISYLEKGEVRTTVPQDLIEDLDILPFPKRDRIPVDYYHDYYIFTMRKPYITMMTSRGCPFRCTFCTSHLFWQTRYRVRSVDNVLKEIDEARRALNVRYIAFLDDIFGFEERWLKEFCEGLIKRRYRDLRWMCILHPFSLRKGRGVLLDLLKESGCDTLSFGLQSAHPEILKNIKRHPDEPVELEKTITLARQKGFLTSIGIIFGLPQETHDTIRHTIDYCCRVRPTYAEFYNLELLEGSEITRVYQKKESVCAVGSPELDWWCKYAARKFYSHPSQIISIMKIILTKNPSWFVTAARNAKHFITATGY